MSVEIKTNRLTLRLPVMDDAPAVARAANDPQIAHWLWHMPYPYGVSDAEAFIARQTSDRTFLICHSDMPIGVVGTVGEFGYWIARDRWGSGFATEASRAVVQRHFANSDEALISGHAIDNHRSRRVLVKLGFQNTRIVERVHKITGASRRQQLMELTKARWEEVQ